GIVGSIRGEAVEHLRRSVLDPEVAGSGHAAIQTHACIIVAGGNARRRTSLLLKNTADLPSAKNFADQILVVLEEGQFIEVVGDEDMAHVEVGLTPKIACIVRVGDDIALSGAVVHAL